MWEGVGGDFLEIWVLKPGFGCVINFELTSNLARMYDCSTKGWEGGIPSHVGTF